MQDLVVRHYRIRLEPDLQSLSFRGETEVTTDLLKPESKIVLDAADLAVSSCRLLQDGKESKVRFKLDQKNETLQIQSSKPVSGRVTIAVEYTGTLNDRMAGFYRTSFVRVGEPESAEAKAEPQGGVAENRLEELESPVEPKEPEAGTGELDFGQPESGTATPEAPEGTRESRAGTHELRAGQPEYMAVTQFEESDARRAFPCFDHPAMKAEFDVELVVAAEHLAISCTPVSEIVPMSEGRKLVRFVRTPKMSTYLLFFGVGAFDTIEDRGWRVPIRVATSPGKAEYGKNALEYARRALEYFERYTRIPYPLGKMDLIAVPDFAFGAMENFGAVTFRENNLLYQEGVTSRGEAERIVGIVVHELAHMWFGDLVSPSEWRYVWLNEAFATYGSFMMIDDWKPEWKMMSRRSAGAGFGPMFRDALTDSPAIELPGGKKVEIHPGTAPIVYGKASSVLHMLRSFLGDEPFRDGVRNFLTRFSFESASTEGFIDTFAAGVERSGEKPVVADMIRDWVRQPGYPVVEVKRKEGGFRLTQSRFTFLNRGSDQRWRIPVTALVLEHGGKSRRMSFLMEEASMDLDLPGQVEVLKLNVGAAGYYRVVYEPQELASIGRAARDRKLPATDRCGVVADLYAQVIRGDVSVRSFLDFLLTYYQGETEFPTVHVLSTCLRELYVAVDSTREEVSGAGRTLLGHAFRKLGMQPREDEEQNDTLLRNDLVWSLALFGNEQIREAYLAILAEIQEGKPVHPDQITLALDIGASSNADLFGWFTSQLEDPSTSAARRKQICHALGCIRDPSTIQSVLNYTIESISPANRMFVTTSIGRNPAGRRELWPWFVANTGVFESMHEYHFASIISGIVPFGGIGRESEVRKFFEAYLKKHPKAPGETIVMALEQLEVHSALAGRQLVGA